MRHREAAAQVAILLAALLACKGGSRNSDSLPTLDDSESPANETPVAVQATNLMADYKGNELRGDGKWKGKLVDVTGVVGDVKKDILDKPYVTLGSGALLEIPMVQCHLASGQEGVAARLSKGSTATFRGRVRGLMMHVQVHECELVPSQTTPPSSAAPVHASPPAKRR
jgi:hypothetical protein